MSSTASHRASTSCRFRRPLDEWPLGVAVCREFGPRQDSIRGARSISTSLMRGPARKICYFAVILRFAK